MAVPVTLYAKGSLFGCDEAWYHGDLTRVEAEQALRASGCDCFLIRQSRAALVLSLIHHGQVHHLNIKHGPGWYELESDSPAIYSFPELEVLVSYYSSEPIVISKDLKPTLRVACERTETTGKLFKYKTSNGLLLTHPHTESLLYETISEPSSEMPPESPLEAEHHYEIIHGIYSKGKPADLKKYNWFHGNISEEHADVALQQYGNINTFLV